MKRWLLWPEQGPLFTKMEIGVPNHAKGWYGGIHTCTKVVNSCVKSTSIFARSSCDDFPPRQSSCDDTTMLPIHLSMLALDLATCINVKVFSAI